MRDINLVKDASFLKKLNEENLKTYYVKILVLDRNENPLRAIEGRTSAGSITISGNSSVRRAGNLTFLAEEKENDLSEIDNLLGINKKIKILVGLENNIDANYDKIIWFNQGIFVITQPALTHNLQGVNVSLQFKDKMCLLNGECGGTLPTSVTFDSYDQEFGLQEVNNLPEDPNEYTVYQIKDKYYQWVKRLEGWKTISADEKKELISNRQKIKNPIFDIIQTLVCNFGGEAISNIIINDVPFEIKQICHFTGNELYYTAPENNEPLVKSDNKFYSENKPSVDNYINFGYNDEVGYVYTDFIYPGELTSAIGDNVCTILDKIKNTCGNYEYFYDVDGRFIFQEKKNYLNTQYNPVLSLDRTQSLSNGNIIIGDDNFQIDVSNSTSSIYTFSKNSTLISSYANTINYANVKNDFHIWGKKSNSENVIHYHVAIKDKPEPEGYSSNGEPYYQEHKVVFDGDKIVKIDNENGVSYNATDWRCELYLQGLEKEYLHQRPTPHEQELLDKFATIYNMDKYCYRAEKVDKPNELDYWIDYINPSELTSVSIDVIGDRVYAYQQDNVKKLFDSEVPDVIFINSKMDEITKEKMKKDYDNQGQAWDEVDFYDKIKDNIIGYTAQEVARNLLYQYTEYTSAISLQSIPIYYLETNNRISVYDRDSNIHGDYVINTINLPLDGKSLMTISASKALSRD